MKTEAEISEALWEVYPRATCCRRKRDQRARGSFRQRCRIGTGNVSKWCQCTGRWRLVPWGHFD